MAAGEISTEFEGQLFKLTTLEIEGRDLPFEFVDRIGSVAVLPVVGEGEGAQVLAIHNIRRGYEVVSLGLPGGNIDGGFDNPEHPDNTALRELDEETGYGFLDDDAQSLSTFLLRPTSSSAGHSRFFSIVRGVSLVSTPEENPNEVVTLRPELLSGFLEKLAKFELHDIYPEISIGMLLAAEKFGQDALTAWVSGHPDSVLTDQDISDVTSPYMTTLDDATRAITVPSRLWDAR